MAFIYGMLRALATGLRLLAAARHTRLKKRYERSETHFSELETDCKLQEVELGRPANFGVQLRLLKAYDAKEKARSRWVRAALRLENGKARESWLKELRGRKIPYTLGLVDMATVLYVLDRYSGYEAVPLGLWQQLTSLLW